ncbi:partial Protein-L-isoaspartate O-methyltransferase, partial [Patescibacteria group bacterium]
MKIQNFGTGAVFKWTKEYLVQVLTDGANPIVTDPLLINALNKIDRKDFLPDTLKNQAYNDVELEIGYSEVLNKPTIIAQMLALLKPKYGGRYLDIGTGTGYSA